MTMRIVSILYPLVFALLAVNVLYVFAWPLWLAVIPIAAAVGVVLLARRLETERSRPMPAFLLGLGVVGLVLATIALSLPAWQLIVAGASTSEAGRLMPIFVAALAFYGANLWLDGLRADAEHHGVDRLARLVAGPRLFPTLVAALLLTAGFVLALEWLVDSYEGLRFVTRRFLERGIIPPATVLLFFWGLLLLAGKRWNGWNLGRAIVRWRDGGDSLGGDGSGARWRDSGSGTGSDSGGGIARSLAALAAAHGQIDESIRFLWHHYEESYLLPRYISWAVPILGFIGTVLGISLAAEGIGRIIASDEGLASLSGDLSGAIAPLGIAFDTTLIALSLSVVLTLLLSLVQRGEERALALLEREVREANRG